MTIPLDNVSQVLESFLALAEKRMPREEHSALVRDCFAALQKILDSI
jgi:hypothetical protein